MKYTLKQLEHLRNVRRMGYDKNQSPDDVYTNEYEQFYEYTDVFLSWLEKMESAGKIEHLLSSMPVNEKPTVSSWGPLIVDTKGLNMLNLKP